MYRCSCLPDGAEVGRVVKSTSQRFCHRRKALGAVSNRFPLLNSVKAASRKPSRCSASSHGRNPGMSNEDVVGLASDVTEPHQGTESESDNGASVSGQTKSESDESQSWGSLIPERFRTLWKEDPSLLLIQKSGSLLKTNLWSLLSLTVLNSAARFVLVWALYKVIAAVAVLFFGIPASSIPGEVIPSQDSAGDPSVYSQLADITFLLFKPLDYIVRGFFVGAAMMVAFASTTNTSSENGATQSGRFGWLKSIFGGFWAGLNTFFKSLKMSRKLIVVHVMVGALTAMYQGICLLIIPFMYAIRRMMNIQLALCTTVVEGQKDKEALDRSTALVEPIRPILYLPYFLLFASPKLLGMLRDFLFRVIPERLFGEVPELTWGLIAVLSASSFLMDRMFEVFPIAVYKYAMETQVTDDPDTNSRE